MSAVRSRDRTTVRRGLVAGAVVAALAAVPLLGLVLAPAAEGRVLTAAVIAVAALALAVGALTALAWILLGTLVDLIADQPPGAARVRWSVGLAVLAVGAFLVAAAARV